MTESEHFAELRRDHVAMRQQLARVESKVDGMAPVVGRLDIELETTIEKLAALPPAVGHVQQAIVDLRDDTRAMGRGLNAIASQHKGDMAAMQTAFERLANRVDGAEEKADATGKHYAPLVRAAADSMVDGVEARRIRRNSVWRIVVGVSLAVAGAGCTVLVQYCGGG